MMRSTTTTATIGRPLQSISFSVAGSLRLVPTSEIDILREAPQDQRTTTGVDVVLDLFRSIGIEDDKFSRAFHRLSCIYDGDGENDIQIAYSVLRKLAYDKSKEAAHEGVYLSFCSACKNGINQQHISYKEWETFMNYLGDHVGGIDSPPSQDCLYMIQKSWSKSNKRFKLHRNNHDQLTYFQLLDSLRVFDAGLIINLKCMGLIITNAIQQAVRIKISTRIRSNNQFLSKFNNTTVAQRSFQIPDIEDNCTLLSQFVTVNLERIEQAQISSSEEEEEEEEGNKQKVSEELENHNTNSSSSSREVSHTKITRGNEQEEILNQTSNNNLDLNYMAVSPSASSGVMHMDSNNTSSSSYNGLGKLSKAALIRRTSSKSPGKTPFHIKFTSLELKERIGYGSYGEVYKATYLMSPVAVKVFHVNLKTPTLEDEFEQDPNNNNGISCSDSNNSLSRMSTVAKLQRFASKNSQSKYHEFVKEVELMSVVRHPNLVLYMGACGDPFTPLCIVSELFTGGSLYEYLHNVTSFKPTLSVSLSFAINIARGMFYLHSSRPSILHRDLKSKNVLLSGKKSDDSKAAPHVVICDFGLCQLFNEDSSIEGIHCNNSNHSNRAKPVEMGTAAYMSPNAINGETYSDKDDVYSYGILLHEIFAGELPYENMKPIQIIFQVANSNLRPSGMQDIPSPIQQLMCDCWDQDREKRPKFSDIISRLDSIIPQFE